jgi:hypothetical protein
MIVLCGHGAWAQRARTRPAGPAAPADGHVLHQHLRLPTHRTRLRATGVHGRSRPPPHRPPTNGPGHAHPTPALAQGRTRPGAARQPRGSSRRAWAASASAAHGASNAPTGVRSRSKPITPAAARPPTSGLGLCTQHRHQHRPGLGRRLLASPAAPASEPSVVRHPRLTELSMGSSPPCDKQRHARDENRERQQGRQTVYASGHPRGHGR